MVEFKFDLCPFCGSSVHACKCDSSGQFYTDNLEYEKLHGRDLTHNMIVCNKCGIHTKPYKTMKGLVKMWNRRYKR